VRDVLESLETFVMDHDRINNSEALSAFETISQSTEPKPENQNPEISCGTFICLRPFNYSTQL